ncbi:tRNA-dependent cyclodipeptide synthase [Streptomyces canus]|uniref:tRNA-dependent cyclodipeptide synthase n=1 Tax=Streptomyces canus TaxID=58343 RepID=UPI00382826DC
MPPTRLPTQPDHHHGGREEFLAVPLTEHCRAAFTTRVHACVGISPFNSYFSAARIAALTHWALASFEQVHFFVPDTAAAHTLEALGYSPERAAWKARRQGQYVRNKIVRALIEAGADAPENRLLDGQAPTPEQLRLAVRYFLAEMPLFLDTPRIANVTSSVFCYHQVPNFLDELFHRRLTLRPADGQGYVRLSEAPSPP